METIESSQENEQQGVKALGKEIGADCERQVGGEGDLPMAIWLRGDEDFFSDFSLDAEEVMEQLGIKRSRLRQISGKELRVARKRVERYIKPFYRPEDVQEYQEWTRPTASHQRSSLVLNSAADHLFEKSRALTEHLEAIDSSLSKKITSTSQALVNQLEELLGIQLSVTRDLSAASHERRTLDKQSQASLFARFDRVLDVSESQGNEIKSVLEDLLRSHQSFVEAIGLVQSSHQLILDLSLKATAQDQLLSSVITALSELNELVSESLGKPKPRTDASATGRLVNSRRRHSAVRALQERRSYHQQAKSNLSYRKKLQPRSGRARLGDQ